MLGQGYIVISKTILALLSGLWVCAHVTESSVLGAGRQGQCVCMFGGDRETRGSLREPLLQQSGKKKTTSKFVLWLSHMCHAVCACVYVCMHTHTQTHTLIIINRNF